MKEALKLALGVLVIASLFMTFFYIVISSVQGTTNPAQYGDVGQIMFTASAISSVLLGGALMDNKNNNTNN